MNVEAKMDTNSEVDTKSEMNTNTQQPNAGIVRIVARICGGLVLIGVIMALTHLFTSHGPIQDGISDALGAISKALDALASGCDSQANCPLVNDETGCKKSPGCAWTVSSISQGKSTCRNATGRPPSDGGPFKCALGLFGLFAFLGVVVCKFTSIFLKCKSEGVNHLSLKKGKSVIEMVEDIKPRAEELAEAVSSEHPDLSGKQKRTLTEFTTNKLVEHLMKMESTEGNPEQRAEWDSQVSAQVDATAARRQALENETDPTTAADVDRSANDKIPDLPDLPR